MGKKIMVVDDEPDVAFTVEHSLKDLDCKIIRADTGEKCIELLEKGQIPDLILLDIMMPGMSGWEVFNKLKENESWDTIPVVFLTARVDHTAENAGNFLGDDYIEKPYDPVDLKKRIEKILERN
jgi:two-component system response regulator VicR